MSNGDDAPANDIPNMIRDMMIVERACHDGLDHVNSFRAFDRLKSAQQVDFVDFVRIPSGASIGRHFHHDDSEWYVIISGTGRMWFKGTMVEVGPWDVLVNPPHHEHGLVNHSSDEIVLVVMQLSEKADA